MSLVYLVHSSPGRPILIIYFRNNYRYHSHPEIFSRRSRQKSSPMIFFKILKKLLKISLFFVILCAVILEASIPAVNEALTSEELRNSLLQKLATSLGGEMEAKGLIITLDPKNININCTDLKGELLHSALSFDIQDAVVKVAYSDLLQGSFFPTTLQATSPRISYSPPSPPSSTKPVTGKGSREFNDLLKKILDRHTRIAITDGSLTYAATSLSKINIWTTPGNHDTIVKLSADIEYHGSVIPVTASGTATSPFAGPLSYEFEVEAAAVPLTMIPAWQDFFFSGGTADFSGKLMGNRQEIKVDATVEIDKLDMTVGWTSEDKRVHQEKPYRLERCTLAVSGYLQGKKIDFPTLSLQSDDFRLLGSFIVDFADPANPFIDLRLRSDEMKLATLKMLLPDPLINDWTTQTIFPRLENGTARMIDFILAGTLNEIARLNKRENAHCLSWSGILRDVDTFYNDHRPLARIDSANLSMNGDFLQLSEVRGKSGKSTLSGGNLSIRGLYDQTPILTTEVKGSFSLSWLTELARAGLLGEPMQQMVSPLSSVSGQVNGYVRLSLALADRLKLQTLNGKGTAVPLNLALNNLIFPLRMKKANFTLDYPGICKINGKGSWGKSTFSGSLDLVELDKKQQLKLNIRPDLAELKKIFPNNGTINALAPCIATLPLQADISLENRILSSHGSLDFSKAVSVNDSVICEQLFAENQLLQTDYSFNYQEKNLTVKKIDFHTMDGNMQVQGVVNNIRKSPFTFKKLSLQAKDFPVQSLKILMPTEYRRLNGILTANLAAVDCCSQDNIWQTISGRLAVRGWAGSLADSGLTVKNIDLSATAANGQIEIKGTNILLADFNSDSPLTLQGNLQKGEVWDGTIRLYGKNIDLTPSSSLLKEKNSARYQLFPIGKIRIIAGVDQVRFRNMVFSPFLMESIVTGDRIITSKLLLQLSDDFIWLTGYQQNDDVVYTSYFKIRQKPVDTFLALIGFNNDIITGMLDMEGKLTARVTPGSSFLETTNGPIYFKVMDGTLESSSTLIKILDLISLENIFDKQDILDWKNSFNYSRIEGRFDMAQGRLSTDSFIMDAPAFDLFAEGSVDLLQDTVNMQVKLAPFGTINKLFSSIPFFGYILTGKTKSIFDYTFSVVGKIGSPDVKYTPLIGTVQSLTGYVKRLVSSRKEVKENINSHLKLDMDRKKSFILRMNKELSQLHPGQ